MKLFRLFAGCLLLLLLSVIAAAAQVVYSDGFEGYNLGAIDKNLSGGPNAAPNGSGNPWFGPAPPNLQVVASGDGGVTAHSGNQMVRGLSLGSDFDQEWYNLAYRLNGGNSFQGNVLLDWWFYDPLGSGGSNFRDYIALGTYNSTPAGTDYPTGANLNPGGASQRLSLGASNPSGFDATEYQARVAGAVDGLASGWFNLSVTRSVGWHEARITLGAPAAGNTTVSFYIDDMVNPALVHNIVTSTGVNVIEMNGAFGPTPGYFDDINLSLVPEPGAAALLLSAIGSWLVFRRRK